MQKVSVSPMAMGGEVSGLAADRGVEDGIDQEEGENRFEEDRLPGRDAFGRYGGAHRFGETHENNTEGPGTQDTADDLCDPIDDHLAGFDFAGDEESEGDCGVDVGAAVMAVRVGEAQYHKPVGEGGADEAADADSDRTGADEDQCEGPDQLRDECPCVHTTLPIGGARAHAPMLPASAALIAGANV
jgi:hypothetical protein